MTVDTAKRLARQYRNLADEAELETELLLKQALDMGTIREVSKLRTTEKKALQLAVLSELFASFVDDPDATAAWLTDVVDSGKVPER